MAFWKIKGLEKRHSQVLALHTEKLLWVQEGVTKRKLTPNGTEPPERTQ